MIKALSKIGYTVHDTKLNSADYQVAQSRERVFIVGVRTDSIVHPFMWPAALRPKATAASILDPENINDLPGRLPATARGKDAAMCAYKAALCKHGIDARYTPILVDIDCSKKFDTFGINMFKTLTKTRGEQGGQRLHRREAQLEAQDEETQADAASSEVGEPSAT